MKQLFTFLFLALSFVLIGCEKNIANEEQEDKKQGTGNNTSASAGSIDDGTKTNAMTVAEAQEAIEGSMICVKGYIVGATQKSINNIEFESPFPRLLLLFCLIKGSREKIRSFMSATYFQSVSRMPPKAFEMPLT